MRDCGSSLLIGINGYTPECKSLSNRQSASKNYLIRRTPLVDKKSALLLKYDNAPFRGLVVVQSSTFMSP